MLHCGFPADDCRATKYQVDGAAVLVELCPSRVGDGTTFRKQFHPCACHGVIQLFAFWFNSTRHLITTPGSMMQIEVAEENVSTRSHASLFEKLVDIEFIVSVVDIVKSNATRRCVELKGGDQIRVGVVSFDAPVDNVDGVQHIEGNAFLHIWWDYTRIDVWIVLLCDHPFGLIPHVVGTTTGEREFPWRVLDADDDRSWLLGSLW